MMSPITIQRSWFLPGLAALLLLIPLSPAAAQIQVRVNGDRVRFPAAQPVRSGGRVLIPLRAVVESLGAQVDWDPATQTITGRKGERNFTLQVGSHEASVDGRTMFLDALPQIVQGTTMVPLRFVAEALGAEVEWNAAAARVSIRAPEVVAAHPSMGRVAGEVVRVDPGGNPPVITVRVKGVRETYRVGEDTIILRGEAGKRGAPVELAQIRPGDQVRLRVDPETGLAEVVEATDPEGAPEAEPPPGVPPLVGEVTAVRTRDDARTLTVRTGSGVMTFDVPEEVTVTRATGNRPPRSVTLDDLRVGDEVRITRGRDGTPTRIEAREAEAPPAVEPPPVVEGRVTGEVTAVRSRGNTLSITVRTATDRITYEIPRATHVMRGVGKGRPARVNPVEIQVGDQVVIVSEPDGMVTRIEATGLVHRPEPDRTASRRVTGEVVAVQPDARALSITVRSTGKRTLYKIPEDTVLFRDMGMGRGVRIELDEVEPGDQVRLRLDPSGTVAEVVEVTPAEAVVEPQGAPAAPEITYPDARFRLGDELIVEGTAAPRSKVIVEVGYTGRTAGAAAKGTLGTQEVTADRDGRWVTEPFRGRIPASVRRPELTIRAVVVDQDGTRSKPTVTVIDGTR
jgi:copper amine oxidase-like protein